LFLVVPTEVDFDPVVADGARGDRAARARLVVEQGADGVVGVALARGCCAWRSSTRGSVQAVAEMLMGACTGRLRESFSVKLRRAVSPATMETVRLSFS
jgi:hypothetical protein